MWILTRFLNFVHVSYITLNDIWKGKEGVTLKYFLVNVNLPPVRISHKTKVFVQFIYKFFRFTPACIILTQINLCSLGGKYVKSGHGFFCHQKPNSGTSRVTLLDGAH